MILLEKRNSICNLNFWIDMRLLNSTRTKTNRLMLSVFECVIENWTPQIIWTFDGEIEEFLRVKFCEKEPVSQCIFEMCENC